MAQAPTSSPAQLDFFSSFGWDETTWQSSVRKQINEQEGSSLPGSHTSYCHYYGTENSLLSHLIDSLTDFTKEQPSPFLPVVLYGQAGSGKTFFCQLITHKIKQNSISKCKYLSGTDLYRNFHEALELGSLEDFRKSILKADFFILDNLEQIFGKKLLEQELVSLLDILLDLGKQVIITLNEHPVACRSFDRNLISRLCQGNVIPIKLPGSTIRLKRIQEFCQQQELALKQDEIEYLTEITYQKNYSQIQGLLQEIYFNYQQPTEEAFSLKTFIANKEQEQLPSISAISKTIAKYFKLKLNDLRGTGRKKELIMARLFIIYFSRDYAKLSFQAIGEYLGDRDHSTIIHAYKKITKLKQTTPKIDSTIKQLQRKILI